MLNKYNLLPNENSIDVDAIEEEPSVTFELTIFVVGANQVKIKCKYGDKKYILANDFAPEQDTLNIKELIPGLNVDLAVTKDGSIIINGADPKVNLKLKTNTAIMNMSSFSCNKLEVKANSVLLYHDITVNKDCYVDYNEHLGIRGKLKVADALRCEGLSGSVITNYGSILAHNARFNDVNQLSAKIINHGLISTKQELDLGSKSLYNYGVVLAAQKLISFGKSLFNAGTIFADQGISLNYTDSLNNLATGVIASNNKIHLRRYNEHDFIDLDELPPTISLCNQGKVITLDKLVLSTLSKNAEIIANHEGGLLKAADLCVIGDQFVNEGKIIGEQQIAVRLSANKGHWYNKSQGKVVTKHLDCIVEQITNDGKIAAQQEITSLLHNLRNLHQGEITGNTINLIALEKIINESIIKANEQLAIYCNTAENSTYGQLLGNKVLLSCEQLENQGDIISQKSCEIVTALLDNLADGKIISGEELSLAIENQLYNEGYLFAGQGKIKAGKKLINGAYGTISASEIIDLTAATVINDGNIDAPQINLTAINKFNQRSTGRILANLLQIKGHALACSGEILTKITAILEASKELVVSEDGKITGDNQVLISGSVLVNAGDITSQSSLVVDVYSMEQSNAGQMVAPKIAIKAREIANAGIISANNSLSLSANTLNNLYNAIIESASQLTIDAACLANAGIIEAYGQLQLKILYCLDNLANGHINSLQDLIIEAGGILKNRGFINADTKALITLSDTLSNEATGVITAKNFDLQGGWKLENYGTILAQSKLQLDIRTTINNYQSGTISSQAALEIISKNLNNSGQITANNLELSLQNILNNYQTGKIAASQSLNLIGAKLILNAGEVTSERDLNITAIEVLDNLKSGKITAQASLQLIGELLVENNGLVAANKLKLAASQLLLNGELHSKQLSAKGEVIAGDGIIDGVAIDFTADLVRMDGKIIASSLSIEAKNYLQLLKNGSITCTEASKLITQAGFISLGKILNHNKLAIVAKDVFHDATANLSAEGELYIKAINAYLDGDIKASQNLFLLVTNQFEYNTAKLTANGELHLTLKDGSEVKQNINTAGDLKIEFLTNTGVWYNEQQLTAGGELTLDIPGVIFVNGKSSKSAMLQAKKNINLHGQELDTGCGKIQADKLNTHTTADIKLNKDSNIEVNSVLLHTDAGKIEQQTALKLTGDAELLATQAEPIIYPIADATGAIKQFKPNPVTNSDGADALAAIYQLAGTKEVGWAARIKASQQLKEHIEDPIVHQLITEEVTAALLSANDLSTLATIGLTLTTEELTLLSYYKLANSSSKVEARDQELLAEELQELVASKLLTYIETSIAKSNFWFALSAGSSGVMGAIGHINNINFNVFTDTTDGKPQQTSIAKLCTHNTQPDVPIHNIYVTANKDQWQFALLTEVIANQNPVNSTITVEQPIKAKTVKVVADGKITITSQIEAGANNLIESLCADVEIKSLKARSGNHENFDDYILSQARVAAGKLLSIRGINIILQKAETASGEAGTYIEALANILDIPVDVMSQRIQHFYQKRKFVHIRDTYLRQQTSLHQSKGNFNSFAGNSSSYYAPTIEAQEAIIASTNETTLFADVHDSHEHHEDIRTKKRRFYGGSKKTHKQGSAVHATSHGTRFKVKKLKVSGANVELRNVHSSAEHNLFAAPNGKVSILQGVNRIAAVNSFTSSEPLWQRQSSKQENHTTYSASTFTGTIEIAAKTAEIEAVFGQVLSFLNQITVKPEDTVYKTLYEHHEVHTESKEGPGAALIALVALATTLATQGMASGWAAGLLGATSGFTHEAITAGFQSIMAQAASAIVANNGDLDKALKDLCQKDTLKKLATTMLSAGVMDKVAGGLDLPKVAARSMPQNVVYNVTKATVDAGLATGISGKDFDKALQENLINAAFATLGNKIDLLDISKNNNTLLHAMLGSARGTVNKDGWLPGMLESVISARLPEYMQKLRQKRLFREQLGSELKRQAHIVQDKFKTDASGRFVNGEQIFSDPALIEAIIKEGKVLVGDKLSQDELSKAIHAQLKLVDLNELGNIGKGLYNTDSDFRKYVNYRTAINNQAINQSDAIPLKDGYQLQPVNLVTTIAGVAILSGLAVAYMATRVSRDNTWSKLPAFEQNQAIDLDSIALKISQHTIAAKKQMQEQADVLTDQDKYHDLCDYLRNLSSQQQAQHFTDVGYGIFKFVKETHPLAYKTKYQETGDGIGVHAATTMYGKAAVRSCEFEEWEFEKSAKDGEINEVGKKSVAGKSGSVRHDMLYRYKAATEAASKTESYDIKTGNAKVTRDEAAKKAASLPKAPEPRIYEVRPNGVYPTEIIVEKRLDLSPKTSP